MKECDKAALFKRHPGCHPDCDFLQGYLVAADELLVNIWKYDKMASSHVISRNWRYEALATNIVVTEAARNGWITFGKMWEYEVP